MLVRNLRPTAVAALLTVACSASVVQGRAEDGDAAPPDVVSAPDVPAPDLMVVDAPTGEVPTDGDAARGVPDGHVCDPSLLADASADDVMGAPITASGAGARSPRTREARRPSSCRGEAFPVRAAPTSRRRVIAACLTPRWRKRYPAHHMKTRGILWVPFAALACTTDPAATPDGAAMTDATMGGDDIPTNARCDPRSRVADGGTAFNIPDGCPLPNLIPSIDRVQIQTRVFAPGACEVVEGCTMPGRRRLLRFDLRTPNIGDGDLYLGPPVHDNRPDARFEYGTCHMHYHFRGYADYRLVDATGREAGMGHKQSFCLLDSGQWMGMGRVVPLREWYTCNDQGIHAGWFDLYDRALDCQYIDITGIAPGTYRVRARINELHTLTESNYDDNETTQEVTIPAEDPTSTDPTDACPTEVTGAARECGWLVDRGTACTPGTTMTVGCNAMCTPAIGSCAGNPVLRVCGGDGPCTHAQALAESDDACGGMCPQTTFVCPLRGRVTVMTGASRAGGAYECRVELR
jgi:hypothetical protein